MARKDLSDTYPIAVGAFRAVRSATQSLGVASPNYLQYDSEVFDVSGWYGVNAGAGGGRIGLTAGVTGIYHFSWGIVIGSITGYMQPELRINGVARSYSGFSATTGAGGTWAAGDDYVKMNANEFAEMVLNWNAGGATISFLANAAYSYFAGHFVGAG